MRFITIPAFAVLTMLSAQPSTAQTLYTCGDATVRNVHPVVEMVTRGPVVYTIDPLGEPQQLVEIPPIEPRLAYRVTVQLFNRIYTAEAFADAPENFDPTRLREGDTVAACVNRQQMILDRGDGTDFRASVLQTELLIRPTGTR